MASEAVVTTVPRVVVPPALPLTLQVTADVALPAPETVAVKTSEPPVGTVPVAGASATVMEAGGVCTGDEFVGGDEVLPHAERNNANGSTNQPGCRVGNAAMREFCFESLMHRRA